MKVHYEKQGKEVNAARMRMATLPEGTSAARGLRASCKFVRIPSMNRTRHWSG